jgi:hypothetical protein
MFLQGSMRIVGLTTAIALWAVVGSSGAEQVLITEAEARLPPAPGAVAMSSRGVTRGPRVELRSPDKGASPASPVHLQIRFTSFGGAKIDSGSVKVTYMKSPAVDLTSRVKAFTQPTGIDLPAAVLPDGEHLIRVDVVDDGGRASTAIFMLKIGAR